ncbi:hypothetical protein C0991_001537, partial [Blastosporella zonata]
MDEKTDILSELRGLRALTDGVKAMEDWDKVADIKEKASLMSVSDQHLLSTLYGLNDVQTNTSSPFRHITAFEELGQRAQREATNLQVGVNRGE